MRAAEPPPPLDMGRTKLVLGDFHMGSGHRHGELNPWEAFSEDHRLQDFLRYHSTQEYSDEEVELVLNGDVYDFLQVPVGGRFPLEITEEVAVEKLRACMDGHPEVHAAFATFLAMPNKTITVLPGNHDFEWVFPAVQRAFRERVAGDPDDPRVRVIVDRPFYEFDGIQVHHGQQFELMHNLPYKEMLLARHHARPILNLPWGSQFIIRVLTRLKAERPYMDRVRPFRAYLIRALVFDPVFFLKVCWLSTFHFLKTRVFNLRDFGARMRQNWRLLTEIEVYPDLLKKVVHLFREHPRVHTIILGHTHVPMVRRVKGGQQYVNSGCWTDTVSLDLGSFGQRSQPTYVHIEYVEGAKRPEVKLRRWYGLHTIFQDLRR